MATNTAASFTNRTGNGSAGPFNISFSYLSEAEVDVTVGGVLKTITTHYTFTSATQITFTSGNEPANGVAIKFQRNTNISSKKVDFVDGSVLTEADLDANSDQVLFAQQEIIDKLNGIEDNATQDQTAAEIRTLVESASDSNVFTDADHSKLNAIEASATADQTAAEIRTLVESASDSNVFTDADHTKLNGIEASATADQTAAEIRTLVESATDSNVFTDADHTKLNAIEAGATADQTVTEIKNLIAGSPLDATHLAANSVDSSELVDGSIDTSHLSADCVDDTKIADNAIGSEHLQANSVTTSEIADAELTTLAGMQSGTASKLADSTALTSDIADLNQLDGMAKQTTISDDDTKFPTSGAIVDYVAAQLAPIGGLEVIATDAAFPNTQPASGVVISIADAGGLVVNSSGTSTTARTVGGSTVTINNFASNFNSSTIDNGVAVMVSSTGSGQIYNYHKATLKEADLLSLSNDINDFAARYRVTNGEPTSNNDEGDLIYDTQADKMKVFDSTTNAFKEVTSVGDFKFLFLCPAGGSGSPTINGSIATYDLREGSTSGSAASVTNAAQLIVSINGVIQKPNTGTSAPSEGFAMVDSNTIIFGSNLPTGSQVFVIQIGSAISLQVPADNTVSSAKIQNQSVITSKLADQSVTLAKLEHGTSSNDGKFLRANNGADPTFETITGTTINNNADNRIITGSGTANTLNAESGITFSGTELKIGGDTGVAGTWGLEIYQSDTANNLGTALLAGNAGAELQLRDTVSGETIKIAANGQASFYSQKENDPMVFFTKPTGGSDTERVRISGDGNVGIGNNNPDQKLKIEDSSDVAIHILKTGSQDTLIKNTGQTEICAASGGGGGQRIVFKIGASTGSMSDIARFTDSGLCFGTDTAAANALDDYEEGSWSPTGSWTTISAEYIKIGRMVYAGFSLRADTTGSANVEIGGLPFTAANQKSAMGGIAWGLCEYNSTNNWIGGFVDENTTTGKIFRGGTQLTFGSGSNNLNNSAFIRGTFIYYAAS